ncbi:MAG: RDD family protein [Nitriliruptorales bacterium]|nr:RDD family protein [Nitriliruptorales bacterium]
MGRRALARMIDLIVVALPVVVTLSALGVPTEAPAALVTFPLLHTAYHVTFEFNTGATPAKRLLGLRVTGLDGERLEPLAALNRNAWVLFQIMAGPAIVVLLLNLAWSLFGIAIVASAVMRPDGRGIHDRWSNAVVSRHRKRPRHYGRT